jgi:hypothetical protein
MQQTTVSLWPLSAKNALYNTFRFRRNRSKDFVWNATDSSFVHIEHAVDTKFLFFRDQFQIFQNHWHLGPVSLMTLSKLHFTGA